MPLPWPQGWACNLNQDTPCYFSVWNKEDMQTLSNGWDLRCMAKNTLASISPLHGRKSYSTLGENVVKRQRWGERDERVLVTFSAQVPVILKFYCTSGILNLGEPVSFKWVGNTWNLRILTQVTLVFSSQNGLFYFIYFHENRDSFGHQFCSSLIKSCTN